MLSTKISKYIDHDKFKVSLFYTEFKGHAADIARKAVKEKISFVCAVGGDGTIHEIGIQLIGTDTALCIIPKGSGNGIANHLGLPKKYKKAIFCINRKEVRCIDTVAVNDSYFIGTSGFGIDAIIAQKFDSDKKRGFKTYLKHSIKAFINLKPIHVKIELGSEVREVAAFMLCIANTSEFGNRFRISPQSSVTDGILEMLIVHPFPKWKAAMIATNFFGKKGDRSKYVETIAFKEARLQLSESRAHYDGEFVKENKSVFFKVMPKSLNIVIDSEKLNKI